MSKSWQLLTFKSMKKTTLLTFFLAAFLASCGQDYNSNYNDKGRYAPIAGIDSSTPDGARLLASYRIMQDKCFQCHQWSSYKSSAQWVAAGKVVAGSTGASSIYTNLINAGGNMPPAPIAQLTSEEVASIEAWINGI